MSAAYASLRETGLRCFITSSHGSSGPKSIHSALRAARRFVAQDVNGHIRQSLAANRELVTPKKPPQEA